MKIISWNVNGIRANQRKGGFDWLLAQNADIFCIQETKARPEQLDDVLRNPPGYYAYFNSHDEKKGYSGVALYTKKKPIAILEGFTNESSDEEGRIIGAEYEDFYFINIYFPNGGGGPVRLAYKLQFYEQFLTWIQKLEKTGKAVVFCGDVNTAHTAIDLARPKENEMNTGFLPEERAWIDRVIKAGYVDTFRYYYPDQDKQYTYWDMKTFARDRNVGWRIDYFFVSKSLIKKVQASIIRNEVMGSDHCPIELQINVS